MNALNDLKRKSELKYRNYNSNKRIYNTISLRNSYLEPE